MQQKITPSYSRYEEMKYELGELKEKITQLKNDYVPHHPDKRLNFLNITGSLVTGLTLIIESSEACGDLDDEALNMYRLGTIELKEYISGLKH